MRPTKWTLSKDELRVIVKKQHRLADKSLIDRKIRRALLRMAQGKVPLPLGATQGLASQALKLHTDTVKYPFRRPVAGA